MGVLGVAGSEGELAEEVDACGCCSRPNDCASAPGVLNIARTFGTNPFVVR